MYARTVTFEIKLERIGDFMPLMRAHLHASQRKAAGCHQIAVCQPSDEKRVYLCKVHSDVCTFQSHVQGAYFRAIDAAVFDEVHQ